MSIRISPSILSADFGRLESEILEIASADFVHVDVMDNHFVPNLTIGLPVVKRLAEVSPLPVDAHLMIADPDRWAAKYADVGVASCTFHLEAAKNRCQVREGHSLDRRRAAVAIKPGTPVEAVFDLLTEVDMVLVMTVEPGFGGQEFMPDMLPKLGALRKAAAEAGTDIWLEVDGGIPWTPRRRRWRLARTRLVAGSSVFGHDRPRRGNRELRAAARRTVDGDPQTQRRHGPSDRRLRLGPASRAQSPGRGGHHDPAGGCLARAFTVARALPTRRWPRSRRA